MKLKYQIPTSLKYLWTPIIRYTLFMGLIISLMAVPSHALKEPWEYGVNECELIADDIRGVYGGYELFLGNGNWSDIKQLGHVINVLTFNNKIYYIDYGWGKIFSSKEELQNRLPEYNLNFTAFYEIHYQDDSMKVVV